MISMRQIAGLKPRASTRQPSGFACWGGEAPHSWVSRGGSAPLTTGGGDTHTVLRTKHEKSTSAQLGDIPGGTSDGSSNVIHVPKALSGKGENVSIDMDEHQVASD